MICPFCGGDGRIPTTMPGGGAVKMICFIYDETGEWRNERGEKIAWLMKEFDITPVEEPE